MEICIFATLRLLFKAYMFLFIKIDISKLNPSTIKLFDPAPKCTGIVDYETPT